MKRLILLSLLLAQPSFSGEFFYKHNDRYYEAECRILYMSSRVSFWYLDCETPVPSISSPVPVHRSVFFINNPNGQTTKVKCPMTQYRVYDRDEYTFIIDCDAKSIFAN